MHLQAWEVRDAASGENAPSLKYSYDIRMGIC